MDEKIRVPSQEPAASEQESPVEETENEEESASDRARLSLRDVNLFLRDLVIIVAVIVSIRFLVATPFEIRGSSMETTYHDGEYIIADKLSYLRVFDFATLGDPDRGDVVVFHPGVHNAKEFYIKRVIGLPGDRVRFENGEVYLTPAGSSVEVMLDESYLSEENAHKTFLPPGVENDSFVVPAGEYFLMGDNRNNSSDSRSCFLSCFSPEASHYVPRAHIVGKVFVHLGHFDAFGDDSYFSFGSFSWTHPPRFFSTASTWDYPEVDAVLSGSGAATPSSEVSSSTGS